MAMGDKNEFQEKDHKSIEAGFLPSSHLILQFISNTEYYAVIKNKDGEELYSTLVGWAYLVNGVCMPLLYDSEFKTLRNPEVLEGFIRIEDADYEEEEEAL
jgi:hypothetical protein